MEKFPEAVHRGVQDVVQVGSQLSQIVDRVQALAPRVQLLNEEMQAQATGAEQISEVLRQLTEAAQQTVQVTPAIGYGNRRVELDLRKLAQQCFPASRALRSGHMGCDAARRGEAKAHKGHRRLLRQET
jgi:methyl-accepting chemotaxis protein